MSTLYRDGVVDSPDHPAATALVEDAGTVAWVGTEAEADRYADGVDRVVRLDRALVTPAFVDAHAHLSHTGLALGGVDVSATPSLTAALGLIEAATRRSGGRPLYVHSWDEVRWPERRPPTAAELNRATYGSVVYMPRVDGHSAVVSSALAAASGARGAVGWDPSGLVTREANHRARNAFDAGVTAVHRRADIDTALRAAAAVGIGLLHEHAGPHLSSREDLADVLAAPRLARDAGGALPQVVGYWAELANDPQNAAALVAATGTRGLAGDLNIDGSIGSRTASMRAAYDDAHGTQGNAYLDADQVAAHVAACTLAGVQAGFHVIGDAGMDVAVSGLRAAARQLGREALRARRHRLEHCELTDDDAIGALADLGVVASVQPAFDAWWGGSSGMYSERLGVNRAATMNRFGDLAAAGITLALGSDSPVTPFDPWAAIGGCVRHHTDGQRLTARAAFDAHTSGGWSAAHVDDGGRLRVGAPATLAVWDVSAPAAPHLADVPGASAVDALLDVVAGQVRTAPGGPGTDAPTCLLTLVGGTAAHRADGFGA